jgi:Uma2 family endonuclease
MGIQGENWIQRHQLTVDQYYQMARAGLLSPEDRVELIEGEVIDMAPIDSEHAGSVDQVAEIFREVLGKKIIVRVQNPVRLSEHSEPEPDIALLRSRAHYYRGSHPTAADVLLIVEIARTSLRYDREIKLPLYAKHGIPEVWIIDLEARWISVHRDPQGERYLSETTAAQPAKLSLFALPGAEVDLSQLF